MNTKSVQKQEKPQIPCDGKTSHDQHGAPNNLLNGLMQISGLEVLTVLFG